MSIYFEKAQELGNLILQSDKAYAFNQANEAYQNSEKAMAKMAAYKDYQANIQQSVRAQKLTPEEIKIASQKLGEMAAELKQDPILGALIYSENEYYDFINQVMAVLKASISGRELDEDGCSGCSGCGSGGGCSGCGE